MAFIVESISPIWDRHHYGTEVPQRATQKNAGTDLAFYAVELSHPVEKRPSRVEGTLVIMTWLLSLLAIGFLLAR